MKISNNILVGVAMPIYCEFYSKIHDYIYNLNESYKNKFNDDYTLMGLIVCHDDTNVYEEFFVQHNDIITKYSFTSNIAKRTKTENESTVVSEKQMINEIKTHKYVFDIDYFISNQ